eukprot:2436410-Alexandrium_andersonii.AAC.1
MANGVVAEAELLPRPTQLARPRARLAHCLHELYCGSSALRKVTQERQQCEGPLAARGLVLILVASAFPACATSAQFCR